MGGGNLSLFVMFYTYIHFKADTHEPFYIGKGQGRRHLVKTKRNNYWNNVVRKHGFTSEILCEWNTEHEALDHEKFLIQFFKDIGAPLVNLTDGGEGTSGWVPSDSWRAKKSASQKANFLNPMFNKASAEKRRTTLSGRSLSKEHKEKIALSLIGNTRTSGRKLSESHKKQISASLMGNKRNLGHKMPDDVKEKIRQSLSGKPKSPETIAKQVEGRRKTREKKLLQFKKESL